MTFTQWVVEYAYEDFPDLWGPVILDYRTRRPLIVDTRKEAGYHCRKHRKAFGSRCVYRVRKVTLGEIDCD